VYNSRLIVREQSGNFSVYEMMFEAHGGARRVRIALAALCLGAVGGLVNGGDAFGQEGAADAGRTKSATCAACHGVDGNSVTPEWPSLAGQHPDYIVNQLQAYKNGERQDPGMVGFASTLSDQDMRDLAAFYSEQTLTAKGASPDLAFRGEEIYRGGIGDRGVPACIACHGPAGHGNYLAAYPRISGQHATYMLNTMREYAAGTRRSDTEYNQMMRNIAELLLEDELRAVTSYAQGLTQQGLTQQGLAQQTPTAAE
jgi:cytochrome c553